MIDYKQPTAVLIFYDPPWKPLRIPRREKLVSTRRTRQHGSINRGILTTQGNGKETATEEAMELSKGRPNQALTQQQQLLPPSTVEKLKVITAHLAKLGVRRQAKLAEADYLVLADDLMTFDLLDVISGLDALGRMPRREGETAFPGAAALQEGCRVTRNARRDAGAQERQNRQDEEERQHRQEHPEEYISVAELLKELKAKNPMLLV